MQNLHSSARTAAKIMFKIWASLRQAKIATILMLAAVLSSCNGATDHKKCLDNVKRVYPNSKIYKSPENNYTFYVVDSTGVREVTTLNLSNPKIDGITEFMVVE